MIACRGLFLTLTFASGVFAQQLFQGDILKRPDSSFTAATPARLWTNNTVPYVLDADVPNPTRLTDGVAYYNQNTPLKFQPRGSEANYVHMVRSTIGNGVCTSNVGMIGGEQFIHVEDACTTAQLIHEMGHTVGFFHEQSRMDRNQNVTVLYENIDKTAFSDFQVNGPLVGQDVGPYDYASHMHYQSFSFSVNNLPTIQTVPAGIPLDLYSVLSPGDLDTLFRMYGQPPSQTTVVTNPTGLQMVIDGQTVTSPQTFSWAKGSTHTLGVVGQTTSTARYLFGKWTDGGAATHTITADPSVTFYSADFVQQVQATVGVVSSGGGTASIDPASPDGFYASQTALTMTAIPAAGYTFLHWSGGSSCPRANAASPSTIVTGSTAINCVATFTQSPVTTIQTIPGNIAFVVDGFNYVQSPVNILWTPGSTHTISTSSASNPVSPVRYLFQNWSDGGAASHSVTAGTGAATLTANYKTQYSLVQPTFAANVAAFTVSPASADNFYDAGTQVQITAVPGSGWVFSQWQRDLFGQPNPATLTMNSQMAFGALFYTTPGPSLSVANSSSFQNTALAPGEIVAIFGTGIGPSTPAGAVLDSTGRLATNVAGTTVTFNGYAAPIVYTSATQTSVVVPYEVAGLTNVAVQLRYNGAMSSVGATVDVSAPGLFASNSRGQGQLAVANQDGTLNSSSNPAARSSVVTFYATGAGQLSPSGVDGSVTASPLPLLTQPVSVRIGGKPAALQFAGPAPSQVSGVLQVNAVVPSDMPPGAAVSVYLIVGNNASPVGTTIAVQ